MIELSWTYFFQIINIIILYLLLRRFLFEPVRAFIERRRVHVEGMIDEANASFAEAQRQREEAERQLTEARKQAQAAVEQALAHGKEMAAEIIRRAKDDEAARLERARKEIEAAKRRAIQEMRAEVADLSVRIAGKIVERNLDRSAHVALIEEALQRMDDAHVN